MKKFIALISFIIVLAVCAAYAAKNSAAQQTEAKQYSIWGATVPSVFMIYIVNPDKLAGWHGPLYDYEAKFILDKYKSLPILGSWHNEGGIPDKEMLLKEKVTHSFIIGSSSHSIGKMEPELSKMGIEVFAIHGNTIDDYYVILRELSKKLDVPERGEELAKYGEQAIARTKDMVKGLKDSERLRVYVADKNNGMYSRCNVEELNIVNAINVYECPQDSQISRQLSFEQILAFDPDVILIASPFFGHAYKDDPKWKRLRAYKNGKIYVVPHGPFGWMDKPAVMKFIGVQWLACELYPDQCTVDTVKETQKFMKLFLHLDISEDQAKEILRQ